MPSTSVFINYLQWRLLKASMSEIGFREHFTGMERDGTGWGTGWGMAMEIGTGNGNGNGVLDGNGLVISFHSRVC